MDEIKFEVGDKVTPKRDRLGLGVGEVVKLGKRPWADVRFDEVGRVPFRFPLSSLAKLEAVTVKGYNDEPPAKGDQVVCRCGGRHAGTVVAELGNGFYGVAWVAMRDRASVPADFVEAHIKTRGHNAMISAEDFEVTS